jgi:membrane peptidoglycan carboxypeptidase
MLIHLFSIISIVSSQSSPTFYFRVGDNVPGCPEVQTFNDGNSYGPCDGGRGVKYTSESKYWVAIYDAESHCGQQITARYNDRSITLTVMDKCPGCGRDNHLDLGIEALIELTGSANVACAINLPPSVITWEFTNQLPSQPKPEQLPQPKPEQLPQPQLPQQPSPEQPSQAKPEQLPQPQLPQQPSPEQPSQAKPGQQPPKPELPSQPKPEQQPSPQQTVEITSYPSSDHSCRTLT